MYFDCYYKVNWNEKHYALKFETIVKEYKHKAQVPYANVMRNKERKDVPVGEYLEIDGKTYLVCDCRIPAPQVDVLKEIGKKPSTISIVFII